MKNDQMDDEAAQKKRGIASADKVGFFKRIRMGNIDDPSSEAYKKLGAGRGRSIPEASKIPYTETDDAKNLDKAAMREKSEVTDERDARETAIASRPRRAPPTTGKAPIVTKEQMKKEGFDNLRDYLNNQRKLTRRKDSAKAEPAKAKAALDRGAAEVKNIKADEAAAKSKPADRPGSEVLAEKMEKGQPKMQGAYREAFGNIRKAFGFEKGGKVESKLMKKEGRGMAKATMQKVASKAIKAHEGRMHKAKSIDGVALRGKTRGRVV